MNNLKKIVKESGINFSGEVLGKILSYVWLILITRILIPKDFGTFTLGYTIVTFCLIFVLLGTHKALERFIPYFNGKDKRGKTKTLVKSIYKFGIISSIIVSIILFLLSNFLAVKVFNNPDLVSVLKVLSFALPFWAIIRLSSSSFIGFKELRYRIYFREIIRPGLKILFTIYLLVLSWGLLAWSKLYVLAIFITAMASLWFVKKKILSPLSKIKPESVSFKKILKFSWPLTLSTTILIFLSQIDFIILGIYRSSAEVGVYKIYVSLIVILGIVLTSFAKIYKPVISELISKKQIKQVKAIYSWVTRWIINMNAFNLIILLFFGTSIITILFTKEYLAFPLALSILAIGKFLNSAFGPEGMTLEAFAKTKLNLLNALIMLLINLGLDILLIPKFGPVGAAIATSSAITIGGIVGLIEIYYFYKIQPYTKNNLTYILAALITALVAYLLKYFFGAPGLYDLIIYIFILGIVYLTLLYFTKSFNKDDKLILKDVKNKLKNMKNNEK